MAPQTCPQCGVKDLAHRHRQPVQEPGLAPAAADSFDPIHHPAEARLGDVRRKRNPSLMVQPVIEKRQGLLREVQEVGPRFRVMALRQRGQQLTEAAPDRSGELADQRLVLGSQRFQLRLPQVKEGIEAQAQRISADSREVPRSWSRTLVPSTIRNANGRCLSGGQPP